MSVIAASRVRTRFAPSPTGDLHVGGAWTALASWALARRNPAGNCVILRIEDLDPPREIPGAADRIAADLAWLGLDWDEGPPASGPHAPYVQSARHHLYKNALDHLIAIGRVYPCDCSRSEIKRLARIASAPHAGEETVYPGTCRSLPRDRPMKRPPALRFDVRDVSITFEDMVQGVVTQDLAADVGDFVLRRADGLYAYQLAVVVDDLAMDVTHVVRGADLLSSTARQIALARALAPERRDFSYVHVPLVVAADGSRLAKRTNGQTIRELRAGGMTAESIIGELAHGLGLTRDGSPKSAADIAKESRDGDPQRRLRRDPWPTPFAS